MLTKFLDGGKLNTKAATDVRLIRQHHHSAEDGLFLKRAKKFVVWAEEFVKPAEKFVNWFKPKWYDWTHLFRVKAHDEDFLKELLLSQKSIELGEKQAQTMQGRWQAYGQMRAARTTGRFALLTTGVLGLGLWYYQQKLSDQGKEIKEKQTLLDSQGEEITRKQTLLDSQGEEIKEKESELEMAIKYAKERQDSLNQDLKEHVSLLFYHQVNLAKLDAAKNKIKTLCGDNKQCFGEYESTIKELEETAREQYKSESIKMSA